MSEEPNPYEPPLSVTVTPRKRGSRFFYIPAGIAAIYGAALLLHAAAAIVMLATVVYDVANDPRAPSWLSQKRSWQAGSLGVMFVLSGLSSTMLLKSVPGWLRGEWRRAFALTAVGLIFATLAMYTMTFFSNQT